MSEIASERLLHQPAIILIEPQLGENVGTAARAMANFGLTDLRLVKPREGWPNDKARAAASRADHVIDAVRVFESVGEAIADLGYVAATTARQREVSKTVLGPHEAVRRLSAVAAAGRHSGVLFGRERTGLFNDELSLADEIITYPVLPTFASLNVAQAVLLLAYEWRLAATGEDLPFDTALPDLAPKADLMAFFAHLEGSLERNGFFRPPEKRPHMIEALRALFQRAGLTDQEVRTLRGVVASLEQRPTRPHRLADGTLSTVRGED